MPKPKKDRISALSILAAVFTVAFLLFIASAKSAEARGYYDGRPARWCGWYMRTLFGGGPHLNLARNWARVGSPARGPAPGVIVVWWHHVGKIVGQDRAGRWLVHSGNDGHAVRTRARSLRGVIAYRWPNGRRQMAMR